MYNNVKQSLLLKHLRLYKLLNFIKNYEKEKRN